MINDSPFLQLQKNVHVAVWHAIEHFKEMVKKLHKAENSIKNLEFEPISWDSIEVFGLIQGDG